MSHKLYVKIYKEEFPRKSTTYSVWICRGERTEELNLLRDEAEHLICVHPSTPYLPIAQLVETSFRKFLENVPNAVQFILQTKEELP